MNLEGPQTRQVYLSDLLEEANSIICDELLSLGESEDDALTVVEELDGFFDRFKQRGLHYQEPYRSRTLELASMCSPHVRPIVSPGSAIFRTKDRNICEAMQAARSNPSLIHLNWRVGIENTRKRTFTDSAFSVLTSQFIESSSASTAGPPPWKDPPVPKFRATHRRYFENEPGRLKPESSLNGDIPQQLSPVAGKRLCVERTQRKEPALRFQIKPEKYTNPLNVAIQRGASSRVLQELVEQFSSVLCTKEGGQEETSLLILLKYAPSDCETVDRMLLVKPACVSIPDRHFNTPLHIACGRGASLDVVRHLCILYPEALSMRNFHGKTPIEVALGNTTNCCEQVVDFLLARREDSLQQKELF